MDSASDFHTRLRRLAARLAREILIANSEGEPEVVDGYALAS